MRGGYPPPKIRGCEGREPPHKYFPALRQAKMANRLSQEAGRGWGGGWGWGAPRFLREVCWPFWPASMRRFFRGGNPPRKQNGSKIGHLGTPGGLNWFIRIREGHLTPPKRPQDPKNCQKTKYFKLAYR